jgi:hypothetical protein
VLAERLSATGIICDAQVDRALERFEFRLYWGLARLDPPWLKPWPEVVFDLAAT